MRHLFALSLLFATAANADAPKPLTSAEVLAQAPAEAWRAVDPGALVLLELESGTVYIELAPDFALQPAARPDRAGLFQRAGGAALAGQLRGPVGRSAGG
jgi:peptidylprolyl isomerase